MAEFLEQLSFDLLLPPNNADEVKIIRSEDPPAAINGARVPDEEFKLHNFQKLENIPTVGKILKMIEKASYRVSTHEFLSDIFECGAIAISNRFDLAKAEKREEQYRNIMGKYDKAVQQLMREIFSEIYILLMNQIHPAVGFDDYLGELYMRSETSSSRAGQFFTPYHLSKACAEITVNQAQVDQYMEQDKILTVNEPACGSGGMVLALAEILYTKYHFNISRNLFVVCSDIDSRCVHMTYLQLGLAGIPAVIYQQNTLTLETWDVWETPAYIMQWLRFRNCLRSKGE